MGTFVNTNGEVIDFATGNVVGRTEKATSQVSPQGRPGEDIPSSFADKMNQLSWGFNAKLFAAPDFATETIGKVLGMKPEETFTLGKFFLPIVNKGERPAQNAGERYSRAIGEGISAGLPISGTIAWAARARPMVAVAEPTAGIIKGIANDAVKFAQQKPAMALAIDTAFNAGYETLRQAVTENVDDSNPNKALYEQLLPTAAFIGVPMAMQLTPSFMLAKAGKKGVDKINASVSDLGDVEKEVLGSLGSLYQLPVINIAPKLLLKNAENRLIKVFGPIQESKEAQAALRELELIMQDKRFAESNFQLDFAEASQFDPLLQKKFESMQTLDPSQLASYKIRNAENRAKLSALFDRLAPEARLPVQEAFKAAQAERQSMFADMLRAQKDLTDGEILEISERLGPQNMDMINKELRGALEGAMEFDYGMRAKVLRRMGLQQAITPEGMPASTREGGRFGKSLYPAMDMEQAAIELIKKYSPDRATGRAPLPEPIRILKEFVDTQAIARQRKMKTAMASLVNEKIRAAYSNFGIEPPQDMFDTAYEQAMKLVTGKGLSKKQKGELARTASIMQKAGFKEGDSQMVSISSGIPGKNITFDLTALKADADLIAREGTNVDINLPEALDYLAAASRARNDGLNRYFNVMSQGGRRVDAQPILNSSKAVYKDIEKLILDHVPKIKMEYEGMKNVLSDYSAGFEQKMPLLMTRKGRGTDRYLVDNEEIMKTAFRSAENLRDLQVALAGNRKFDELLEKGAIDWLRGKNVLTKDGLVDPTKMRRVLDNNRNIVEALPQSIQQKFQNEVTLADDYVKRLGELDQRRLAMEDDELDAILKRASRNDADPKGVLVKALNDPSVMRVLVDELGKNPERLAALRRSVFDMASGLQNVGVDVKGKTGIAMKAFIDGNEKSLAVLFKGTDHLENLKKLSDLQRRVNSFAAVTGQIPVFSSLDEALKKNIGSGVGYLTTQVREVQSGRISGTTGALALLVRLSASLENKIHDRLFTKAIEDPVFAKKLISMSTPTEQKEVVAELQKIGVPMSAIFDIAPRIANLEAQRAMDDRKIPVSNSTAPMMSAREQLRALPPAPSTTFKLNLPTTPPSGAGAGAPSPQMLYPTLFPNDPISAMLQQRQQQQQMPPQQ